jgi:hypothetical protein
MIRAFTRLLPAILLFCYSANAQTRSAKRTFAKKGETGQSASQTSEPVRGAVQEMPPQGPGQRHASKRNFVFSPKAVVDFGSNRTDFAPAMLIKEMPRQGPEKKLANTSSERISYSHKSPTIPGLVLGDNFSANPFGGSTPNDNDMAISDSGYVLSVINTNMYVKNVITNSLPIGHSLSWFTDSINDLHEEFDPKVMYDPKSDRFVMACMVGFVDSTSKIIVGFSKNHNPAGKWNLYELPGDALNNGLWSDYPMIAMTENELFLSVNLLYNDSSWQTGFVETIVWQMEKESGYAGTNMNTVLHSNIKHNGRAIRNLCPAKGGSKLHGPNMYFISNRNLDQQNDTIFLVNVTDVIGSPTSSVNIRSLRTNLPYRFPPDGVQKGTSDNLATNDSRNLGAFFENNKIQYVHNTKHNVNNRPTVQYGVIHDPGGASPIVTGYLVENDSLDYAYPNISYAGLDSTDDSAIITFNHSSPGVFPGCSAVQADGTGEFSPVLKIKDGITYVNVVNGSLERWGDYSGSQRKYDNPGEVWMSGYYATSGGQYAHAHRAWVAQITTDQRYYLSVKEQNNKTAPPNVYPNPAVNVQRRH